MKKFAVVFTFTVITLIATFFPKNILAQCVTFTASQNPAPVGTPVNITANIPAAYLGSVSRLDYFDDSVAPPNLVFIGSSSSSTSPQFPVTVTADGPGTLRIIAIADPIVSGLCYIPTSLTFTAACSPIPQNYIFFQPSAHIGESISNACASLGTGFTCSASGGTPAAIYYNAGHEELGGTTICSTIIPATVSSSPLADKNVFLVSASCACPVACNPTPQNYQVVPPISNIGRSVSNACAALGSGWTCSASGGIPAATYYNASHQELGGTTNCNTTIPASVPGSPLADKNVAFVNGRCACSPLAGCSCSGWTEVDCGPYNYNGCAPGVDNANCHCNCSGSQHLENRSCTGNCPSASTQVCRCVNDSSCGGGPGGCASPNSDPHSGCVGGTCISIPECGPNQCTLGASCGAAPTPTPGVTPPTPPGGNTPFHCTVISSPYPSSYLNNPFLNISFRFARGIAYLNCFLPILVELAVILGFLFFFFSMLIGGLTWITSGGDKARVEAARGRLTNAVFGLIALISVFAIVTFIEKLFNIKILQFNLLPLF